MPRDNIPRLFAKNAKQELRDDQEQKKITGRLGLKVLQHVSQTRESKRNRVEFAGVWCQQLARQSQNRLAASGSNPGTLPVLRKSPLKSAFRLCNSQSEFPVGRNQR